MNFSQCFPPVWPSVLILMTHARRQRTRYMVLGDSLSAGYRMAASAGLARLLLNEKWQSKTSVINASISG